MRDKMALMEEWWRNDVGDYDGDYARVEPSGSWPKPIGRSSSNRHAAIKQRVGSVEGSRRRFETPDGLAPGARPPRNQDGPDEAVFGGLDDIFPDRWRIEIERGNRMDPSYGYAEWSGKGRMSTSSKLRTGRCLCGSVRFEVDGEPTIVAHCHCEDCQRLTGAGHSTGAMFSTENFRITGELGEYELRSDNGNVVTRVFCPSCGSPIFGRNTGMEGFLTISLGIFDESAGFEPSVIIFARNRKPWDLMDESIATFEAQPIFDPGRAAG